MEWCPRCGTLAGEDDAYCGGCGRKLAGVRMLTNYRQVPNHMAYSVGALLLFLPFGVMAVTKASEVEPYAQAGNYTDALKSSREALTWCKRSIPAGIAAGILYLALDLLSL